MDRINVTVRARPLSPEDAKCSPWKISSNSITFLNSSSSKFDFDKVFGEDCSTKDVYESRTKAIVSAAVAGFNGTVFAYGQTNSGKTHTMRGSPTEPGVIPLAVRNLFDIIQQVPDREFLLRMSYLEIYNEEINDLLVPEHRRLQIHENLERGIFVAGLREEIVVSPDQVLDLMDFGESHRHIGETNMNLHSSRSHTIFRMIIESRDKAEGEESGDSCDAVRVSVLNLVDLAGSERAAKTGAEGVRLKEGSHINKSLMTLGTVIKKLSEGAESQGGHVPYRDSKLTRILQPALGGNANTAIICNITLAQVHADETKSSLQFASRALQVTNCARVNEILTDAALLKRQKKEIEELRAKLQGSHSEHLEEEILNLRNTLLQTELERERIALELEEEKKAQVEREKMLEQQAKKIKNLSSMVLYSNRDEIRDHPKKDKRRDTWCPGKLTWDVSTEASKLMDSRISIGKLRQERDQGPLVPFEKLVIESEASSDNSSKQKEDHNDRISDDCVLPDPSSLLKVTRRKLPQKKKTIPTICDLIHENNELFELQAEYEDLFQRYESQRIMYDVQLDFAKQQNTCAAEKCEELYQELLNAKEEARIARTELSQKCAEDIKESSSNSLAELLSEVQQTSEEVRSLSTLSECMSLVTEEFDQSHSFALNELSNLKSFLSESSVLLISVVNDSRTLINNLNKRISELEDEKLMLQNQSTDLREQLQDMSLKAQESEKGLADFSEQYDMEKSELLSHIEILEKELFSLSSSSLSREKESLRKDLEKTKTKLKETESKLKTLMQEKTRLEGERANAEREMKKLHSQKALLERDICKRDSLVGRRRDSCVDRSKAADSKKIRGQENIQTVQEDYKKLEVLAFEMETTIASLEEELATANQEKEELLAKNESLSSEIEMLSNKFDMSNSELKALQEELLAVKMKLDKSESSHQNSNNQINQLVMEKEELAMQLTNTLLELEEEKAVWSAKEKASIEAIKEKASVYNDEITSLSNELSKVRNEMMSFRTENDILQEKLKCTVEHVESKEKCSMEKSSEIDQLKHALEVAGSEKRNNEELQFMTEERDKLKSQIEELLRNEVEFKRAGQHEDKLLTAQHEAEHLSRRLAELEQKMHDGDVKENKERTKLRMKLRCTQAKLDAFRERYKEAINEQEFMHKKFDEASSKLKERLASYGVEILDLKKQLAVANSN